MRFLARLERRFHFLGIPDLSYILVGLTGLAWLLGIWQHGVFTHLLTLNPAAIRAGQVWRLFTFQLLIDSSPIWFFFQLYWMYMVYRNLEEQWGYFRFTLYWFVGVTATAAGAMAMGAGGNNAILTSSFFLAFATLNPNFQINLYLIFPIRLKYLAALTGVFLLYEFVSGGPVERVAVATGMLNYLLFFSSHWVEFFASQRLQWSQRRRRIGTRSAELIVGRKCAICGVTQAEGADIRICSCEKCGNKRRDLCLKHARDH